MARAKSVSWHALLGRACFLSLLLAAGPLRAEPTLALGLPICAESTVRLEASAGALFDGEIRLALKSGLAATLSFEWRLWRERSAWWDDRLAQGGVRYRIFYDILEQRYEAFDESGRSVAGGGELAAIEAELCLARDMVIRAPLPLLAEHSYYVDVMARLQPLDPSEIQGLEDWLRGNGRAALRGISRGARRIFGDDAGLSSRSAIARSAVFPGDRP